MVKIIVLLELIDINTHGYFFVWKWSCSTQKRNYHFVYNELKIIAPSSIKFPSVKWTNKKRAIININNNFKSDFIIKF